MRKKKYQSHEQKSGNVWLNVWDADEDYPQGAIEIDGNTESGYRILRRGRLVGDNFSGISKIILGDAGVFFDKRKDAENFALVLAMHFSGDLTENVLIDPETFNGTRSGRTVLSEARTALFWEGVDEVDPSEGWIDLDPDNILENLPDSNEPLPVDDDCEMDSRGYDISEAAEAIYGYYANWFLTSKVEVPLHEVVSKALAEKEADHCEIAIEDRGYVTLLALAMLRNQIPVGWVFPQRQNEVSRLIPRLWVTLPTDVKEYIADCEADAQRHREQAAEVEAVKAKILNRLQSGILEDNWEIQTRINSCVSYLIEVRQGNVELPSHSEPEYRILMKQFSDRALLDEDQAVAWLVSKLVQLAPQPN